MTFVVKIKNEETANASQKAGDTINDTNQEDGKKRAVISAKAKEEYPAAISAGQQKNLPDAPIKRCKPPLKGTPLEERQ